jgi:hypothetical protein
MGVPCLAEDQPASGQVAANERCAPRPSLAIAAGSPSRNSGHHQDCRTPNLTPSGGGAFSPDGKMLVTGDAGGQAYLWSVA